MTTGSLQKDRKLWLPFVELFLQPNGMCSQPRSTLKLLMTTNSILPDGSLSSHSTTLEKSLLFKCNFPTAVDDRPRRDIFIIGLNDTFKPFRSDVISRENLSTLSFTQVISKARDFEAWLKTETAITKHRLKEAAHKITPAIDKSKTPPLLSRRVKDRSHWPSSTSTCLWCGHTPHANRRDCPASNDSCHACGKRGQGNKYAGPPLHMLSEAVTRPGADLQEDYLVTHEVYQVQSATKGRNVHLDLSPTTSLPRHIRFQVDSGCSCNTIHINDLKQLPAVQITPSVVRLLGYSKSIIPTRRQVTLHCTRRGVAYDIVAQVITAQQYYAPLLGLADSTRIGILKYDVDTAHKLAAFCPRGTCTATWRVNI